MEHSGGQGQQDKTASRPNKGRFEEIDVFASGKEGYHTYRIPALIVSKKGTVLAFCEGRKGGQGDSGKIDLLLKRSSDGGKSWDKMQTVWADGPNTCGNPCPVVDANTGVIWLLMTWNLGSDSERQIMAATSKDTRRVFVTHSKDDGATWEKPSDITKDAKLPHWRWYATGPGHGIQLKSGRLLIPCDHSDHSGGGHPYRSHVIYSDDQGKTWKLGGATGEKTNECTALEASDGSICLNMRSYHGRNRRAVAWSKDAGQTWSDVTLDDALVEPVCQASILRLTEAKQHDKDRVLFCNPASTKRESLTVRLSYDQCKTWPVAKTVCAGPAAYSDLSVGSDWTILCLYEQGGYASLRLARFNLEWLTDGKDAVAAAPALR
jgi:sialidase-1